LKSGTPRKYKVTTIRLILYLSLAVASVSSNLALLFLREEPGIIAWKLSYPWLWVLVITAFILVFLFSVFSLIVLFGTLVRRFNELQQVVTDFLSLQDDPLVARIEGKKALKYLPNTVALLVDRLQNWKEHVAGEVAARTADLELRLKLESEETARRASEHELQKNATSLRRFIELNPDMIYTVDVHDVFSVVNPSGLKLLGYTDAREVIGRHFSEFLLNPTDRKILLNHVHEKGYSTNHETILKRKDGGTVFCMETAQLINDPESGLSEIRGVIMDISERVRSEQKLWKMNLELAQLNEDLKKTQTMMVRQEKLASIGQLAAGIAHEINNPLGFLKSNHNTLAAYFKTLRDAWEQAKARFGTSLKEIEEGSDLPFIFTEAVSMMKESEDGFRRIMEIVSNLKTFARSGTDGKKECYDLNEGIRSTLAMAQNETKYVARVETGLNARSSIQAIGGEINQVLLNLVVNAAQVIGAQKRPSPGLIRVSSGENATSVCFIVEDDGPGVPEKLLQKIFDPFFSTKDPGQGTGLGLTISHDIINRHRGRISLDRSKDLGGARFTVSLPKTDEDTA
jgi:PAS domain S-box-containing protein